MKKEQYTQLGQYEKNMRTAIKSNFVRMEEKDFKKLLEIGGVTLNRSQMACSRCKLNAVKKIGEEYFKYKEWYEKRYKSKTDSNPTALDTPEGNNKKTGRK